MTDGNETDVSGQQEMSAALRAQLDDISETVSVVARAVSDLDHRIQLAQASNTTADQRWEQRISTMESHIAELDAATRAETEQVRGSTSVLELLSHEIRTSLAQSQDATTLAASLQDSLDALRRTDAEGEFAALRHRLGDFDREFSTMATSLAALQAGLGDLRARQVDPDDVVGAIERVADRIAERQPDLAPVLAAVENLPAAIPDFAGIIESVTSRDDQFTPIRDELLALRAAQPDLTQILDALQDLRDRQVDLTPVHEELRELRGSLPDTASVIDAVDALGASLPAQFLDFERRLPDLTALAASLDRLSTQQVDLEPVSEAIESLRRELPDLTPLTSAIEASVAPLDLEPMLEEVRALRADRPDLGPVLEALDGIRAQTPGLDTTLDAIAELRTTLGDSLHSRLEALLTAGLDRQHDAAEESRRELRALDDRLEPISTALEVVTVRLAGIEAAAELHAGDLTKQADELTSLREHAANLAEQIPASTRLLDALADDVREVVAGIGDPTLVFDRLEEISGTLETERIQRQVERAELAGVLDELIAAHEQIDAVAAKVTSIAGAPGLRSDPADTLRAVDERLGLLLDQPNDTDRTLFALTTRLDSLDDALRVLVDGADQPALAPLAEFTGRIEALLSDNLDDIDRAMAARQIEHQSTLAELVHAIPDPTDAVDALGRSLQSKRPDESSVDVAARLDALDTTLRDLAEAARDQNAGEPLSEFTARVEAVLGDIDRAMAARQIEHQSTLAELVHAIPDPTDSVARLDALDITLSDLAEAARDQNADAPLSEFTARVEALLSDNLGDIDRAVAQRQFEHQSTLAELVRSIPDPTDAVDALGRSLAERALSDQPDSGDLIARFDALAERTDGALQAVRQSVEERLSSLDEARSADTAAIRDAVERVGSQERLVADQIQVLTAQLTGSSTEADALWVRTTELLSGVDRVTSEHTVALEEIAASHHALVTRDEQDRTGLAEIARHLSELRSQTESVDAAVASLAAVPDQPAEDTPVFSEALEPLTVAVSSLTELAGEHRARLDAVGRSVTAFGEISPKFEETHASLEHRIEALIDRQADLQSSIRELHPRFDAIDGRDPAEMIGEVLTRFSVAEEDLSDLGPRLDRLAGTLERTEERVTNQSATLDRVDVRAEQLAAAVAALSQSAERLGVLDQLETDIGSLVTTLGPLDVPALNAGVTALSGRVEAVRAEVGAAAAGVIERVDQFSSQSSERLELLEEFTAGERDRTGDQLGSLAATTSEVAREISVLRGDLTTRHDGFQEQLDTIRSDSAGIAASTMHLVGATPGPDLDALTERLDVIERQSAEVGQSLSREVAEIRTSLADQFADLTGPMESISDRLATIDLTGLSAQLDGATQDQQRSALDIAAAMAASTETSDFLRDAVGDLSGRIASIDLEGVRVRLEALENEQRATEQRLASSLSKVHAVVDSFELEPVLGRLEALEVQTGEAESGLLTAISEVRTAALSIDLGRVDSKLSELEQRNRMTADELSRKISEVVERVLALDTTVISESLASLTTATMDQREDVKAAVDALTAGLDLETLGARLDALDRQAAESAALESEVQTAVHGIAEQVIELDLRPISTRLDQLVDTVRATDEASRTSIASEIETISARIASLDTDRLDTRLQDLTDAQDRLTDTVGTELNLTVDRVRSAITDASEERISSFADAAAARDREIRQELQALRETVLDEFSSASVAQRQSLVERIDNLGNTVVDRLDDTRLQTDSLAAQVTSIHAAFATSGPTSGDIRAHVDTALEDLAERIGGAVRDLRREVTDLGKAGESSGIKAAFEAGLDRLAGRFDTDISRVLEALSTGDDTDRLRRIDSSITEIRRDFEVLRRITDQASPPVDD